MLKYTVYTCRQRSAGLSVNEGIGPITGDWRLVTEHSTIGVNCDNRLIAWM